MHIRIPFSEWRSYTNFSFFQVRTSLPLFYMYLEEISLSIDASRARSIVGGLQYNRFLRGGRGEEKDVTLLGFQVLTTYHILEMLRLHGKRGLRNSCWIGNRKWEWNRKFEIFSFSFSLLFDLISECGVFIFLYILTLALWISVSLFLSLICRMTCSMQYRIIVKSLRSRN